MTKSSGILIFRGLAVCLGFYAFKAHQTVNEPLYELDVCKNSKCVCVCVCACGYLVCTSYIHAEKYVKSSRRL